MKINLFEDHYNKTLKVLASCLTDDHKKVAGRMLEFLYMIYPEEIKRKNITNDIKEMVKGKGQPEDYVTYTIYSPEYKKNKGMIRHYHNWVKNKYKNS